MVDDRNGFTITSRNSPSPSSSSPSSSSSSLTATTPTPIGNENGKPYVHCNSTSLCEALGSVRYILNDKTGTLTKNELCLREIWVADQKIEIMSISGDAESDGNGPSSHLSSAMTASSYRISKEELIKNAKQVSIVDERV